MRTSHSKYRNLQPRLRVERAVEDEEEEEVEVKAQLQPVEVEEEVRYR